MTARSFLPYLWISTLVAFNPLPAWGQTPLNVNLLANPGFDSNAHNTAGQWQVTDGGSANFSGQLQFIGTGGAIQLDDAWFGHPGETLDLAGNSITGTGSVCRHLTAGTFPSGIPANYIPRVSWA